MIGSGADADVGGINRIRFTVLDRPTVPVVWLDTFAVANFAAGIAGKGQEAAVHALHYRRLVELVRADALVCLETDQLVELRDKPPSLDASVRVLDTLASRFDATRRGIEDCQERDAMRANLADSNTAELSWSEAIAAATTEKDAPFVFRAIVPDDDAIAEGRERKEIVKDQWSDIQQDLPAMQSEARRFEHQLGQERFGMQQAFDHWLYLVTDADEADGEQLLNALHAYGPGGADGSHAAALTTSWPSASSTARLTTWPFRTSRSALSSELSCSRSVLITPSSHPTTWTCSTSPPCSRTPTSWSSTGR